MPKNAVFICDICYFKCFKLSNYENHNNTKKHLYRVNGNNLERKEITKNAKPVCICGKIYITKSGLWKHNKICNNFVKYEETTVKEPEKYTDYS